MSGQGTRSTTLAAAIALAGCGDCNAGRREEPRVSREPGVLDAAPRMEASVRASEPKPFDPCPSDGTPCRIMPLGDSITDGVGSSGGGYRLNLWRRALADGKNITFVGRSANGPREDGGAFPRGHEGYSGYTIDTCPTRRGISPLVAGALAHGKPHIILLMIGTNDVGGFCDVPRAAARLGPLVDRITESAPDALLVVAEITPSDDVAFNQSARTYNLGVRAEVASRAARGLHVTTVDMYGAFIREPAYATALLDDGLHPNDRGYARMAGVWYAAILPYLK